MYVGSPIAIASHDKRKRQIVCIVVPSCLDKLSKTVFYMPLTAVSCVILTH